ncbi:hypothetical protein [Flagellimonas marinaquae]
MTNNHEAFEFTLNEGHIGTHASNVLRKLKRSRLINYESSSPYINYDNVFKKKRLIQYKIVLNKNE